MKESKCEFAKNDDMHSCRVLSFGFGKKNSRKTAMPCCSVLRITAKNYRAQMNNWRTLAEIVVV